MRSGFDCSDYSRRVTGNDHFRQARFCNDGAGAHNRAFAYFHATQDRRASTDAGAAFTRVDATAQSVSVCKVPSAVAAARVIVIDEVDTVANEDLVFYGDSLTNKCMA